MKKSRKFRCPSARTIVRICHFSFCFTTSRSIIGSIYHRSRTRPSPHNHLLLLLHVRRKDVDRRGVCTARLALPQRFWYAAASLRVRNIIDPTNRREGGHYRKLSRRRSTHDAHRHHTLFFSRLFLRIPVRAITFSGCFHREFTRGTRQNCRLVLELKDRSNNGGFCHLYSLCQT
jgi:hypothetical protein